MRRIRPALALLLLTLGMPSATWAQSARAYVTPPQAALNGQFVLNVEVLGTQQLDAEPALPDLSGFATYLGSGTSTSMQIVNGQTSVSLTIQARYLATREGTHDIGPVEVRAGGQSLRTDPVSVSVSDAPGGRGGAGAPGGGLGPEDLFVEVVPSASRVFVNQAVIVEYRIYTRVEVDGYDIMRLPTTTGFWVEELSVTNRAEQVQRDGQTYASAVVHRVAVFPTSAGPKTLDPLTLQARVRVRGSRRGIGDPFGGFFGGDVFGRRVPVEITSPSLAIEVRPLPPGEPEGFTGLVGRLELSASVDRTEVETNDAVTYRLQISGEGNLRALPVPELTFPPELEAYPPEVSERFDPGAQGLAGTRVLEYVIVPRAPGEITIPALSLGYLDPEGAYAVASSPPLVLTVAGDPVPTSGVPGDPRRTGLDIQRDDIRFIRLATPALRPVGQTLFEHPWFWVVTVTPLLALVGAVAYRRHADRLRGDVGYARRRRAAKGAARRLAEADALAASGQTREFHAEIGRALEGFLGDALNLAEAGLLRDHLRAQLRGRGVSDDLTTRCLDCLDACDRQRFAPTSAEAADLQAFREQAARILADLEEVL